MITPSAICPCNRRLCPLETVADPGFSIGGAPTHWGDANLQRVHFLVKTYAKTKEIDPVGGGHMPAAPPPGSTNERGIKGSVETAL